MFITYFRVFIADGEGGFVEFWERKNLSGRSQEYIDYLHTDPCQFYRVWL